MPSVVIDLERLRIPHCGLGQFCFHLGSALLEANDPEFEPVFLLPSRLERHFQRPVHSVPIAPWRREPLQRWLRPLASVSRADRFDLWHATHQDSDYLPLHSSTPLVFTIHDLNFLREKPPATIRRRLRRLQKRVDRAAIITTVSHFAAGEIRQHLCLREKEVTVIPNGVCLRTCKNLDHRPSFLPEGPFLFAIGDVTPKKNFHVLVEFAARLPDYRLVIAGKKTEDYAARIQQMAESGGVQDRVILPGVISEPERTWLYQNCEAFLFPSLSEGFGLPVVEAMSCGRPVFCSSTTSLPEVGGPLAFYWNDFNPDAMVQVFRDGMDRVGSDPNYAQLLREHSSRFNWTAAANAYLSLYKRVLQIAVHQRAA